MRVSCETELPIVNISLVWREAGKPMTIVRPRSHKAPEAEGLWGNTWKDIKRVSGNNVRELRNNSGRRWGCIPSIRGRVSMRRRRKISGGVVRT
jgi:hypothetical protein